MAVADKLKKKVSILRDLCVNECVISFVAAMDIRRDQNYTY